MTNDMQDLMSLGIYLHLPFCIKKCNYCDFCSIGGTDKAFVSRYTTELAARARDFSANCGEYEVDTVYFGGGTPTLAAKEDLTALFADIRTNYSLSCDAEITIECNPATGGREYFSQLRSAGFNRLSIGLQSTHDTELKILGRAHGYEDFLATYKDARAAGFDNISVDVMYAIPDQTTKSYLATLERLVSLEPEHISAYALKIEDATPFAKIKNVLRLPDEDAEIEMYEGAMNFLASAGYNNYEISNFAKPNRESRHNLRYWTGADYLGFGVAAHSLFKGDRFANSTDITAFVSGKNIESEREKLTETDLMNEFIILGLRLIKGIDTGDFKRKFAKDIYTVFPEIYRFISDGFLTESGRNIAFSDSGRYISNSILSDIII